MRKSATTSAGRPPPEELPRTARNLWRRAAELAKSMGAPEGAKVVADFRIRIRMAEEKQARLAAEERARVEAEEAAAADAAASARHREVLKRELKKVNKIRGLPLYKTVEEMQENEQQSSAYFPRSSKTDP